MLRRLVLSTNTHKMNWAMSNIQRLGLFSLNSKITFDFEPRQDYVDFADIWNLQKPLTIIGLKVKCWLETSSSGPRTVRYKTTWYRVQDFENIVPGPIEKEKWPLSCWIMLSDHHQFPSIGSCKNIFVKRLSFRWPMFMIILRWLTSLERTCFHTCLPSLPSSPRCWPGFFQTKHQTRDHYNHPSQPRSDSVVKPKLRVRAKARCWFTATTAAPAQPQLSLLFSWQRYDQGHHHVAKIKLSPPCHDSWLPAFSVSNISGSSVSDGSLCPAICSTKSWLHGAAEVANKL